MDVNTELILIRITGIDRPGLTASFTEILSGYDVTIMDIGQVLNHTRHWDMKEITRRLNRVLNIFWSQTKLLESLTHIQKLIHRNMVESLVPFLIEYITHY